MAYVITIIASKTELCVTFAPPTAFIQEDEPELKAATQMYVDPEGCIDCGAWCPRGLDAIFVADEVPEDKKEYIEKNAADYKNDAVLTITERTRENSAMGARSASVRAPPTISDHTSIEVPFGFGRRRGRSPARVQRILMSCSQMS